ncbi:hypothetical protein [Haladaptatus halobius]|nr:hypothetical protein [Haladaptatus halobius]
MRASSRERRRHSPTPSRERDGDFRADFSKAVARNYAHSWGR